MAMLIGLYAALGVALAIDTFAAPGIAKVAVWVLYGTALIAYMARFERGEEVVSYRERFEALQRQSMRDPLTGLFHRGVFESVIGAKLARASRSGGNLSLLMVDVDNFKEVNDRFGHCEGDEVLRAVARALRSVVRASDLPCRFGGEEFVLLLPDTRPDDALALAERIRAAVTRECRERTGVARTRPVTVSIGVANAPLEASTSEGLMELADRRLYDAKRGGRDRISASGSFPAARGRPHLHVA